MRDSDRHVASLSHAIGYVWDNAGRLSSTTAGGKTLAYQYDPAGNRTRITWPEVTPFYVTTSYDALNRPSALLENGVTTLASYGYDDLSRRGTVTYGNASTTTSYGYTTQGVLNTLAHNLTGTAQDIGYTYTRNQAQEIASHTWNNDLYQWTGYTNGARNYTPNGLNQYTTAAGATITHDANGNLAGDGVWTYTYDTDNRLKTANKTGLAATLAYDAEGRLRQTAIAGATTNLAYDGVDLVAEYDSAGTLLRRYVHGPGIDEPLVWYEGATTTNKNWLYADHLGSIVATANSAGTSTATYTYGPYGEPNVTTGVRFRYTGQQLLGQLNLYYYKARFYSPALGRFLQTDPIGYADDLNLYAYVGNNPVNRMDPSGLSSQEAKLLTGSTFTGERILVASATAVVGGWIATDTAVPEPTDAAWPKWAIYGGALAGAAAIDWMMNEAADNAAQPNEKDLTKVKERDGNRVAQEAGYEDAHDAKNGRGEGGVDIYRDKSTGQHWLWNGVKGGEKEPL